MDKGKKSKGSWWQTVPGILTATAGIITAATGLIVALHQAGLLGGDGKQSPAPIAEVSRPEPTFSAPKQPESPLPKKGKGGAEREIGQPTVVIEGPPTASLGKKTYYTIVSQSAVRGVWSVGGFHNEPVVVEPLGPSHQIFIEPTNARRVGDSFTIVVVVYSASGKSATARKQFLVVSE